MTASAEAAASPMIAMTHFFQKVGRLKAYERFILNYKDGSSTVDCLPIHPNERNKTDRAFK
jgi:hypothetical protein